MEQIARNSRRPDNLSAKITLLRELSPRQAIGVACRLFWARWSLRGATSLGKYVKLDGRLRVTNRGRLIIGDRVLFHSYVATSELAVYRGAELYIGAGTFVNYGAEFCATKLISIGEDCRIGTHCIMIDNDFHSVALDRRDERPPSAEIVIEPCVWLGNRVTVLKGTRIGYGAVVAAGSVVSRSIPPLTVAAGVPARVLRQIDHRIGADLPADWLDAGAPASAEVSSNHL